MKKILMMGVTAAMVTCLLLTGIAIAAEKRATAAEAEAFVKEAVAFFEANGQEKALAEFSNTKGKFVRGELYIYAYAPDGTCVAHGLKPQEMVGKNLMGNKDKDGIEYVKLLLNKAKKSNSGWVDFSFINPLTGKEEKKSGYVAKAKTNKGKSYIVIGSGIYK